MYISQSYSETPPKSTNLNEITEKRQQYNARATFYKRKVFLKKNTAFGSNQARVFPFKDSEDVNISSTIEQPNITRSYSKLGLGNGFLSKVDRFSGINENKFENSTYLRNYGIKDEFQE